MNFYFYKNFRIFYFAFFLKKQKKTNLKFYLEKKKYELQKLKNLFLSFKKL